MTSSRHYIISSLEWMAFFQVILMQEEPVHPINVINLDTIFNLDSKLTWSRLFPERTKLTTGYHNVALAAGAEF